MSEIVIGLVFIWVGVAATLVMATSWDITYEDTYVSDQIVVYNYVLNELEIALCPFKITDGAITAEKIKAGEILLCRQDIFIVGDDIKRYNYDRHDMLLEANMIAGF